MNMKLIINELNREQMSIDKLKKATFITDDYKLINILKKLIELGISKLEPYIIKSKFMYITNSIEYLKILSCIYPDKSEELELFLMTSKQYVEAILNSKRAQKNIEYHLFVQDIFDKINTFLEYIENQNKEINFEEKIDNLLAYSKYLDDNQLRAILDNYIQPFINLKDSKYVLYEVKRVFGLLQKKKAKSNDKNTIGKNLLRILDKCYITLLKEVEKEYKEQIIDYISTNYKEELETFNSWTIANNVEEPQPFIITIDNQSAVELDDALAVTKNQYGITLHVYIANTTPFLISNPNYESIALERYSSLRIKEEEYNDLYYMLPKKCADQLSLKENEIRSVIDHTFYLDYFGKVSYSFSYKNIKINKRLSYRQVDQIMKSDNIDEKNLRKYLHSLERCTKEIYTKLGLSKIYKTKEIADDSEDKQNGKGHKIVFKAAVLVNYITAQEAIKNNYLLLYQDYCSGRYSIRAPENPYAKITSPIRRYSDLKNNYLLYHYLENDLTDKEYYQLEQELQYMLPLLEEKKERNKVFVKDR